MKLSEKLQNYRADRPDEWTMDEFYRDATRLEESTASLQQELEKLKQGWISVGDRLPEIGELVYTYGYEVSPDAGFTYDMGEAILSECPVSGEFTYIVMFATNGECTHWIPLPAPPEAS